MTLAIPFLAGMTGITGLAGSTESQADRCAPNDASGAMMCVDRNGHCAEVSIDGHDTVALTDEAVAARVHAIPHGEDVCWQVAAPVSTRFRIRAGAGGIFPAFLGTMESVGLNLYHLDDYDAELDSRLDSLNGVEMTADEASGTWVLTSERPLPAGEYVAVFRLFGVDNWDRQAVLLRLDPELEPAADD
jgi:hypothetical protein